MTNFVLGGYFKEPEDEIRAHKYLWETFLSRKRSPAKPVPVLPALGEPSVPLQERCEWHVAPAAEPGKFRWTATPHGPVVDWTLPAPAQFRTPYPAPLVTSLCQYLQNREQQLKAILESEYAQFCRQHVFPLAEAQRLEPKEAKLHEPKVT